MELRDIMPDPSAVSALDGSSIAAFVEIREQLVALFEALEAEAEPPLYSGAAGRFEHTQWSRGHKKSDQGGGKAGLLRGRLFEKAGIHFSHVYGDIPEALAGQIQGGDKVKNFAATGVSLIAHPRNPRIPAAHMNIRMVATNRCWFGGGADLTPMLAEQRQPEAEDSQAFHAALETLCKAHPCADYTEYREYCDRYFFLPHRGEPRGAGGIFFDHLDTSRNMGELDFVCALGRVFAETYGKIVRQRMKQGWNDSMRQEQLVWRGRYVEFNLLYDRGTSFGLKSDGNVAAILSSLPPVVRWP